MRPRKDSPEMVNQYKVVILMSIYSQHFVDVVDLVIELCVAMENSVQHFWVERKISYTS